MVGIKVRHISWGSGTVTFFDGKYIRVEFSSGEKKFVYPDIFEKFIEAEDTDIQNRIIEEIKKNKESIQKENDTDTIITTVWNGDTFVFKNKKTTYDKIFGYAVYDCYGEDMVGVVWSHKQKKGQLSEGQAEIRFLDKYKNEYHKWRLVFQNGWRMPFDKLEGMIKDKEEVKLTIDPWQGKK